MKRNTVTESETFEENPLSLVLIFLTADQNLVCQLIIFFNST